jgi:adenylate cyclase
LPRDGRDVGVAAAASPVPSAPPPAERRTLAVLPFENLSPDPAQEYFTDGIGVELLTRSPRASRRR